MAPIPGTGEFRPRRAGHCRRPAAGGKRGQDTKVSCPLLRLPNFPLAATPFGRAAKVRGTQLKPRYHRRLFDAVWGWLRARFPRMTVRGSGCRLERYSLFFFRAIKNRTDFCPCGEIFRQTPFELKSCTPPFPRRWRAGYSASTRAARLSARCTAVQECRACR